MALPVRRRDTAPQPALRWDPVGEFESIKDQLAQIVQRATFDRDGAAPFIPLVDSDETENAWIVEADLPGVEPPDVNVEFDYHITLPGDAHAEHIEAELREGVLTVRIAKPEHQRPRRIDVKTA